MKTQNMYFQIKTNQNKSVSRQKEIWEVYQYFETINILLNTPQVKEGAT